MKMVKNIVFPARSRANYFFIVLVLSDNDDKVYDKADYDDDGVYNFDHDDDAVAALISWLQCRRNNSSLFTSAFEDCHSHAQIICCWLHRDKSNKAYADGGIKVIVHSSVLITVTIHDLQTKFILRTLAQKTFWLPKTNHLHEGV